MLILLFIVFVGLFLLTDKIKDTFVRGMSRDGLIIAIGIVVMSIIFNVVCLSKTLVIDEKIEMYKTENTNIELQIGAVVTRYMTHEKETFAELKTDSSMVLVSLYPELKSDELIKTQIATYQENNAIIKELKEIKINSSVYKWWLYFGH